MPQDQRCVIPLAASPENKECLMGTNPLIIKCTDGRQAFLAGVRNLSIKYSSISAHVRAWLNYDIGRTSGRDRIVDCSAEVPGRLCPSQRATHSSAAGLGRCGRSLALCY